MNLNEIRLIEACYNYLVTRTSEKVKQQLMSERLVVENDGNLLVFNTSEDITSICEFIEYKIDLLGLTERKEYILDYYHLFSALRLKENQLGILSRLDSVEKVRVQIFKMLINADIDSLKKLYPEIKKNNFVYNLENLTINQKFPVYKFSDKDSFTLVGII
ncbi:hypothetical protein [Streptococcus uberis]|uniref:hypothetical protein n=1 Tax=Streptococcus uberis TaxID=1349 RepID=UPI00193A6C4A|nr:hypothetical protein [Streptococcus uberis]